MSETTKKTPIELSDIEKEFINKIFKAAFKERGWKPIQFARELGFSSGWSSNLMRHKRGRKALSINLLYEIADKLGIDPASLLPGTNPEERPEFEEYLIKVLEKPFKKIVREEIEKALKKK